MYRWFLQSHSALLFHVGHFFSATGDAGLESSHPFVHYFWVELDRGQLPEHSVPGAVECSGIVFMEQGRRRWGHLLGGLSVCKTGDGALIQLGSFGRFAKQVKERLEFGCKLLLAGGWQGMSAKYSDALGLFHGHMRVYVYTRNENITVPVKKSWK